ncbi:MAG: protein-glutamate O-methyltransferase [Deltaproteobacteria bacterium]|jgi:chemotaxis protein methyltransferase CheR|nr:protein-glutamate O-methyltransferase [Deltaproteobacteria bacterium]
MDRVLAERLFQQFSQLVYQQCGIRLHEGKKALLQARLNKRLRATGIPSYEDYYHHITSGENPPEMVHFLDSISTNLTYFFRESQHFEFLENVALPQLIEIKVKSGVHRLRVWSAGCSTGEEAYGLAMCVLSRLDDPHKWDFRILATDISTRVLEIAAKGIYAAEKIKKVPPQLRQIHFIRRRNGNGEGEYEVSGNLRKLISFRRLNLNDRYPFKGPFDCIFCRNVMIYFDKKTQEELVNRLATYLSPGGYLFVGHSESLTGLSHPLVYVKPAVYRNG